MQKEKKNLGTLNMTLLKWINFKHSKTMKREGTCLKGKQQTP